MPTSPAVGAGTMLAVGSRGAGTGFIRFVLDRSEQNPGPLHMVRRRCGRGSASLHHGGAPRRHFRSRRRGAAGARVCRELVVVVIEL